jgi:xanthine dehydrogenase accessory factor
MDVFEAAAEARRSGRPAAMATVIGVGGSAPRAAGARMLVYEDGSIVGTIGGGNVEHHVIKLALEVLRTQRPARFQAHLTHDLGMCCGGQMEVYVEPLEVREPLVLFGAGHVARATAPLLAALGFQVTVVDDRDDLALPEHFPGCAVHLGDPLAFARSLSGGPRAYWLVVTHDHKLDQDLGEVLLPKECAWLGMIGSRAKIAKFLVRYRAAGMDESLFRKLSGPVGLDIGAETPTEIAVSIAAEVVRVRRRVDRVPLPLASLPLAARGGDGTATPPALQRLTVLEDSA